MKANKDILKNQLDYEKKYSTLAESRVDANYHVSCLYLCPYRERDGNYTKDILPYGSYGMVVFAIFLYCLYW